MPDLADVAEALNGRGVEGEQRAADRAGCCPTEDRG